MNSCKHLDEIEDYHEGTIICKDCGLVKDSIFISQNISNIKLLTPYESNTSILSNILDKINAPEYYSDEIASTMTHASSKNLKKVTSEIYKKVNQNISSLPLKTLMHVSGLSTKQITSEKIHIMKVDELCEKYLTIFGFDYNTCTVIKEKIKLHNHNGFQPLSIIGGIIYLHSVELKKKISMKKIASYLGISPISIQRFIKHEFSSRS